MRVIVIGCALGASLASAHADPVQLKEGQWLRRDREMYVELLGGDKSKIADPTEAERTFSEETICVGKDGAALDDISFGFSQLDHCEDITFEKKKRSQTYRASCRLSRFKFDASVEYKWSKEDIERFSRKLTSLSGELAMRPDESDGATRVAGDTGFEMRWVGPCP